MLELFSNILNITWQQAVMWVIGGVLIYLAIAKDMERSEEHTSELQSRI